MSQDPIGFEGGLNVYGYVNNNPLNFVDPDGLIPQAIVDECRDTSATSGMGPKNLLDAISAVLIAAGIVAGALEAAPFLGVALIRAGLGRYGIPLLVGSHSLQGFSPLALLGFTKGRGNQARVKGQNAIFEKPTTLRGACPDDVAGLYQGSKKLDN